MSDETLNGAAVETDGGASIVLRYVASAAQHLTGCTDEAAIKAAERALGEAEQLNPVIEDAGGSNADQHPRWGIAVNTGEGEGKLVALKPSKATTNEERIQSLVVLGIVTSPIARAAAYAQGFQIAFFQAPPEAPKPKIILT